MIRVALAQINTAIGDFAHNASKITAAIESAKKEGAALVVFPELAVTGYPPEDLLYKEGFIRAAQRTVDEIAKAVHGICAVVGYPRRHEGKLYNAAAVMMDGRVATVAHKTELPNYGVFDEKRYFASGDGGTAVVNGVRMGITICEDIWVEGSPVVARCARPEVDLVLNLSSSPYHLGKTEERRSVATTFAKKCGKPLIYCNLTGGQDELVFDGGSFVCGADGVVTASAREFAPDLLIADVPLKPGENTPKNRIVPPIPYPENVWEALKLGVRDYVEKNGFKNVLVALSGGIDSALTAAVAVAALGRERVWGVAMPSKYSSEGSVSDARALARNLDIRFDIIPITDLMDGFDRALGPLFAGTAPGLAEENIQARIRGNLIMALSNKYGALVLATGNKSEIGVGYCTLYGDMAGGFAVIKDLPKTRVYDLCRWINGQSGLPRIPDNTITKPPSAELRPGQLDSDSLPGYGVLDTVLRLYVEEEKSVVEIIALGYDVREVRRIASLVDKSEYKRRQTAPGVKLTPKAFGKDRRVPITNRFIDGVEAKEDSE